MRPTPDKLKLLQKLLAEKGIETRLDTGIGKRAAGSDAPLSFGQQRLWFLQQFEPDSSEYNDTLTVRLEGIVVDAGWLEQALQEVVRRHELLRTAFVTRAGIPVQQVLPELHIPLRVVDLRSQDATQQATALEQLWLGDVRGQFRLEQPPLIRATLAQLRDDQWEFGLTSHHIVSDGVAYSIIFRELAELYSARLERRAANLPALPIQFSDYAQWERDTVTETVVRDKLEFWKRYLGDAPALRLPYDRPRTLPRKHDGDFVRFRFGDALFQSLQQHCRREQVTSNWVLLAAYFALMHSHSGQEDFIIGLPSSTRVRRELEGLVGFFVQTVILRLDLTGNPTFRDLTQRAQKTALDVSRYEDVPFDRIFQAVRPGKTDAESPLIQAWIGAMKNLLEPMRLPGATVSYQIFNPRNARFDLVLILDETQEQISGYWEYDVSLFDRATVERLHQDLTALLEHTLRHPDTRLSQLAMLLRAAAPPAPKRPSDRLREMKKIERRA